MLIQLLCLLGTFQQIYANEDVPLYNCVNPSLLMHPEAEQSTIENMTPEIQQQYHVDEEEYRPSCSRPPPQVEQNCK